MYPSSFFQKTSSTLTLFIYLSFRHFKQEKKLPKTLSIKISSLLTCFFLWQSGLVWFFLTNLVDCWLICKSSPLLSNILYGYYICISSLLTWLVKKAGLLLIFLISSSFLEFCTYAGLKGLVFSNDFSFVCKCKVNQAKSHHHHLLLHHPLVFLRQKAIENIGYA